MTIVSRMTNDQSAPLTATMTAAESVEFLIECSNSTHSSVKHLLFRIAANHLSELIDPAGQDIRRSWPP